MRVSSLRRPSLAVAAATALVAIASPAAAATPIVKIKASSQYAVLGFPVTVTVTSSESGTLTLSQVRADRQLGAGRCMIINADTRYLTNSTRAVLAGSTTTFKLQPAALAYYGGSIFAPRGWNDGTEHSEGLCWDQASQFKDLMAMVATGTYPDLTYTRAFARLTRIL